ncbi:hypothetical protein [Natronococcus sp.]|uniref:hypothetical protein n=1 Tax=Natronococcus sp. TaxID=35747 RepID=UPI003A4D88A6
MSVPMQASTSDNCDWTYKRSLHEGDLSPEENTKIADRVIRHHEWNCTKDEPGNEWGDTVEVEKEVIATGDREIATDGGHPPEIENCPNQDIPKSNPFRDRIIDLRSDGHSWEEIWELLEEAYNPVDRAAFEEWSDQ